MQILTALDPMTDTPAGGGLPALGDADDFAQFFQDALPAPHAKAEPEKITTPAPDLAAESAQNLPDLPVITSETPLPAAALMLPAPAAMVEPVTTIAVQPQAETPDKTASDTETAKDLPEASAEPDDDQTPPPQQDLPPVAPATTPAPPPDKAAPMQADITPKSAPMDKAPAPPAPPAPMPQAMADVPAPAPVAAPVSIAPATQAPDAALPETLSLDRPGWSEKLLGIAQAMATRAVTQAQTQVLTLTLTPETLGPMQIRIEVIEGQTHLHIVTETAESARIMAEAQPRLNDLMARAGLDLATSTTTSEGRSGQDQPQPNHSATTISDEAPPQDPAPQPRHATPLSQFDLIA
jgi:flagellar hook-length control protein FliK